MTKYVIYTKKPEETEILLLQDSENEANAIQIPEVNREYTSKLQSVCLNSNFEMAIPLFTKLKVLEISWAKKNYSYNLKTEMTIKISVLDLFPKLEKILNAEILNEAEIIKDITHYDIHSSGGNFQLNGNTTALYSYHDVSEYQKNRVIQPKPNKIDYENLGQYIENVAPLEMEYERGSGYVTTVTNEFKNIAVDINKDMTAYPYNFNDLDLELKYQSKKVKVITKRGSKTEERYVNFCFLLKDSVIPTNIFDVNFDNDQLENKETFQNYAGYRYKIMNNCIHYMVCLRHNPDFAYQYTILPMQMLQLLQIFVCLYGDTNRKLANILTMYVAYGAFAIKANADHVQTNDRCIFDKTYYIGIVVSFLQFVNIITLASLEIENKCNTIHDAFFKSTCAFDGVILSLAIILYLYSLFLYMYVYSNWVWKKYACDISHEELMGTGKSKDKYWDLTIEFVRILDKFLNLRFVSNGDVEQWMFKDYKEVYSRKSKVLYDDLLILDEWRNNNIDTVANHKYSYKDIFNGGYDYQWFAKKFDNYTLK